MFVAKVHFKLAKNTFHTNAPWAKNPSTYSEVYAQAVNGAI